MSNKLKGAIFAVMPVLAFYLMEAYEHNPFIEVRQTAQFFNIVLFEFIAWILFFIIRDGAWALRIELFVAMVFGLTNHYVMAFRSTPFVPWDVFSIKTASSVASNYDFTPSARVIIVTLAFILLIGLSFIAKFKIEIKWYLSLIPAVVIMLGLGIFVNALQDEDFQNRNNLYPFLFTPAYMTKVNGMAVTFAMDLAYIAVDKPSGYKASRMQEELSQYDTSTEITEDLPNIIVIMDEAFSDLKVIGDFATNQDYMPFVHSLQQGAPNTITGYANVSVCGGNTANSEYEFLTGNSMAFLPVGSIPYQQYLKGEGDSLARHLKGLGYNTYAQHPYYESGWCRNTVYPSIGFDNTSFIQDYTNKITARGYVSDETDFNYIIKTFENKPAGEPAFIFNVTMQNHGGYTDTYPDFSNTISALQINSQPLAQYLSLVKMTDQELEGLFDYFSKVDEKTVIVFFGDHQPNDTIAAPILSANGKDYRNLSTEDMQKRYQVPYIIWANYDIAEATGVDTSLNYLGAEALRVAGVPTSAYENYLLKLKEDMPVISAVRTQWTNEEQPDKLLDYKRMSYYQLFDWKEE